MKYTRHTSRKTPSSCNNSTILRQQRLGPDHLTLHRASVEGGRRRRGPMAMLGGPSGCMCSDRPKAIAGALSSVPLQRLDGMHRLLLARMFAARPSCLPCRLCILPWACRPTLLHAQSVCINFSNRTSYSKSFITVERCRFAKFNEKLLPVLDVFNSWHQVAKFSLNVS